MKKLPILALIIGLSLFNNPSISSDKEVFYHALEPAFVVNLQEKSRFVKASVQIMAHEEQIVEDVKQHNPAIRHEMIMLLSDQSIKDVTHIKGREKLRSEALAALQKVLEENTGKKGIEAVFFTSFFAQ